MPSATPPALYVDTPWVIAVDVGPNSLGKATGRFILVGDDSISPNPTDNYLYTQVGETTVSATTTVQSTGKPFETNLKYVGTTEFPGQWESYVRYSPDLTGIWTLNAANSFVSTTVASAAGPAPGAAHETLTIPGVGTASPPPSPSNVQVTGFNSLSPTISWSFPGGVNGAFFDIFDPGQKGLGGQGFNLIYSQKVRTSSGSIQIGNIGLTPNHSYVVDIYGVDLRNPKGPLDNINSIAWSQTFFNLSLTENELIPGAGTSAVNLPYSGQAGSHAYATSVTGSGVNFFEVASLAPSYTVSEAVGSPSIRAVTLPDSQSSPFSVAYLDASDAQETATVSPGATYSFPGAGVGTFSISGTATPAGSATTGQQPFIVALEFASAGTFNGSIDPAGATLPCFASGTQIETINGPVRVEELRTGAFVRLYKGGFAPVIWLGHRTVDCRRHPRPHDVLPVRIVANAIASGCPSKDLILSPDHALLFGNVLIPVRYLVNGATVRQETVTNITYWHVELPQHSVLFAEQAPAESYLDTGNRAAFVGEGGIILHPQFGYQHALEVWQSNGCAPLAVSGTFVEAVRRDLLRKAGALGWRLTSDSAVQVRVDGRPAPIRGRGIRLPAGTRQVMITSRYFIPEWLSAAAPGGGGDARRLGLALAVTLDGAPLPEAAYDAGWHSAEQGRVWRWTDGDARLNIGNPERPMLLALRRVINHQCFWSLEAINERRGAECRKFRQVLERCGSP